MSGQQYNQQTTVRQMTQQHSSTTSVVRQSVQRVQEVQRVEGTTTRAVQGAPVQVTGQIIGGRPSNAAPPVFEQIFRNARFAQGGNAVFEGKVKGSPRPTVNWSRAGSPLTDSPKYQMSYDENTGKVALSISSIGPGDEGEYTCKAVNQYGEAVCTVYIQPEMHYVERVHQDNITQQHTASPLLQKQTGGYVKSHFEKTVTQRGFDGHTSISKDTRSYSNGIDEHFRVDTFEYRLLREAEFREALTHRILGESETETEVETESEKVSGPLSAPQLQQKPRSSKLLEGSDATFQAKIPGNPPPKITWFKNGVRLVKSQRIKMTYINQIATLTIRMAMPSDTGHYTLLSENVAGRVVCSAYLAVEGVGLEDEMQFRGIQPMEIENGYGSSPKQGSNMDPAVRKPNWTPSQADYIVDEEAPKSLAPAFLIAPQDKEVTEGKMVRFDCRVSGRPYPEVTWYLNGVPVKDDVTHKILVNEAGNHSLMINITSMNDAGEYTCIARNKSGETSFKCHLNVVERENIVPPKFVERFAATHAREGETVIFTCRAVGTPMPHLSWQKDGVPIQSSPRAIIHSEGGTSTLEITKACATDSAWYQCTAHNAGGSTATRAKLQVQIDRKQPGEPWKLSLPRPTKVIQPEAEQEPEVIYLRHVERAKHQLKREEEESRVTMPPVFTTQLNHVNTTEGGRAIFEARLSPVSDPSMKIEWFVNGKPLEASSRVTTTHRFGYVAMTMLHVTMDDSCIYTCRATNDLGTAETSARLNCEPRATIESKSQHPESLEQIQMLEDYSKYQRTHSIEEMTNQKPVFIRELRHLGDLPEGSYAHFEAQIQPVNDPFMRIEWYHNGSPLTAGSRISTIFNFGYVAINITYLRPEDSGEYTVRAFNRAGEATSTATFNVISRDSVVSESGIPEQQRYISKIEELEYYQQQQYMKMSQDMTEVTTKPVFKIGIKDQGKVPEGGIAHFEARLEPTGDPNLRVEWYKDGKPLEASSRITAFFNFGYVALTIKAVTIHDVGTYECRAYNKVGETSTTATLACISRKSVEFDSQYPGGLEKIQHLEDSSRYSRSVLEETHVTQKPRFLGPIKGTNTILEGQNAHFETRLEPPGDPNMTVEWFFNGKPVMTASRIKTYHDFGYVAMDILSVRSEDSGTYTLVARNKIGEEQASTIMEVKSKSSIDTSSMHKMGYEKTRQLEDSKFQEPHYYIEEISKSKPIFTKPLEDQKPIPEGKGVHLECRLEPMGDPTMRVEWFFNGRPITIGSRFKTYFDFGYVALDISGMTSKDTGEYTVRATNHLGSAHTSTMVKVLGQADVLGDPQNEAALEQIHYLEDASRYQRHTHEEVTVEQQPSFVRPLHNIETLEGANIHLECRLQPVGDSSMRVEWYVNGQPIKTGHRFRPAYEFDYVALDILSVYQVDSGVYTCRAVNKHGEAVTSATVKCIPLKEVIMDSQHPEGLEQIQYLEDASRYRRQEWVEETIKMKPKFMTKLKDISLNEGQTAHFECRVEPLADPNLRVEWFRNGKAITVGHRFRPLHDFGYVALDILDVISEDSGVYTCRAINNNGVEEVAAQLSCSPSAQIYTDTTHVDGIEVINQLEERSRHQRTEVTSEITSQSPVFTSSLKSITIKEGQRAHFECRIIPVSDPTMKVYWFHNGKPVKSGSRFTESNNFGFVALDIMYAYPEDSGTYTLKAVNALGEAITSATLNVTSKQSISLDTVHHSAMEKIQHLEDSSRHHRISQIEESVVQAPVFTQPMKNLELWENQPAHFECRLIPVGDPHLKVEWFKNGMPLQPASRITTLHDFGFVALDLTYVYPDDSGTYTCKATNDLGQAVTSATLAVHSKASAQTDNQAALEKIHQLEDYTKYQRTEIEDLEVTSPPVFVTPLQGSTKHVEGQSSHFECRIEPYPDPSMKVEWFFNGKPLQTGHRFRSMYDFGFCALDILSLTEQDAGEYTVRATNKLGQAVSSITIDVKPHRQLLLETQHPGAMDKIQYLEDDNKHKRPVTEDAVVMEKPNFGRPLRNIERLTEGKTAHLEATLTPVNDPTMKVEWFFNGRPIKTGHRFKPAHDFGFVALDILCAYPEDSGTYMCKATNAYGEAITTCSINVDGRSGLLTDTMDADRLKKLRQLEETKPMKREEEEIQLKKPEFIIPLKSLEGLKESEHAHLECRVEPINDPDLKIEWFVNGKEIKTGHRFRTTHDFGYVALDILYTYPEDSGTYMCKATNKQGEAVSTCTINCSSRRSIYLDTQHPEGWQKIRELESFDRAPHPEEAEMPLHPPKFTSPLQGTKTLKEGQTAHLEAKVEPVHDPNLKIEFFHNGKPLTSGSRFHITFDFGYVALDISHCVPEDQGEYVCRAYNKLGEDVTKTTFVVEGKSGIIYDSQHPEGLDKIRQLEGMPKHERPDQGEPQTFQRPVFTVPLQNLDSANEGNTAHFECRLIPVGDPTMKVEWFRNEKIIEPSSRITTTHDFGFVSMDMTHVRDDDEGVYMCRATNSLGEAVTTASLKVKTKASIQMDSKHPEGLQKIKELEQGRAPAEKPDDDVQYERPVFTSPLTAPSDLIEGQHIHMECRVVPVGDPTMRLEWYINGMELKMGSRFHTTNDFGFVTLDINSVIPEDAGVYMCKAINRAGDALTTTSVKIHERSGILGDAMHPEGWRKIQEQEGMGKAPQSPFVDLGPQQPPVFTTHLQSYEKLVEGQNIHLEAHLEPANDPNMKVEWFKNGVQLMTGTRMRTTHDFGLVSLDINAVRPDDSGIYTCKATNLLGEAVTTGNLKVDDKGWLIGSAQRPEALPLIADLEGPKLDGRPEAPEPIFELPTFITHMNDQEVKEGLPAHFECRVEPSKDPTLEIEFFVNGKPLPSASRFTITHEFGFVSFDIQHCWPDDAGVYMCKATNNKGSAMTSGSLKVISKEDIYRNTQHPMGEAGLEKIQRADNESAMKQRKPDFISEATFPKPVFVVPLSPNVILEEGKPVHLECQVEPKEDPKLVVEWFFNGKALEHATRFVMRNDFGQVTFDLMDTYQRDSGIYTCRAKNDYGEAFTTTTIVVAEKGSLIEDTQHPKGKEGLEKIQHLEESLIRKAEGIMPEEDGHPPIFTSQFEMLTDLAEGDIAHFEASLTPVGDQTMNVEWFFNGKPLEAGHRIRTVHAFGMVVLEILGTYQKDSGIYTCKAKNKWGEAEISVELQCVDRPRGQKPQFTTQIKNLTGLKDGDSAHFECTLVPVGDPKMKVEWFHNGKPLRHSSRIKTVHDFGFVVLDIAYVQSQDSGEYVCRASNMYGEDKTIATIHCLGKGGVYFDTLQPDALAKIRDLESTGPKAQKSPSEVLEPPKFTVPIKDVVKLKEGQSAHFEARLIPTKDPNLTVEWFFNGKKLPHGHRFRTFHDFGIVILDILYCYEEDSGLYECRAVNKVGEDSTRAELKCVSKANLILTPQIPKEMEGGLDKIQNLEDGLFRYRKVQESEKARQAPVFTVPLQNSEGLREGENAHFEARLIPVDDPSLKLEWYHNGKPLRTGTRIRTFCDFGFVILEISPVYPEDSGEYSCRAYNDLGEAVTSCNLKCEGKRSIILDSQLPKGMEGTMLKIAELEGLGMRSELPKESEEGQAPVFLTQPSDLTLVENSLAHFECRLEPVGDPSLKVVWYHNGKPLSAGSRIKTINDFGFVILEMSGVYQRDAGLYTCKATNSHGEASVSCSLQVKGRQGIIFEPQLPKKFQSGTESIQKLEESLWKRDEQIQEDEEPHPPKFITEISDLNDLVEGGPAHFDCRVEPVGDPSMRIEWFHNGRPLNAGSRIRMMDDFGFVVLDIDWTFPRDCGEYVCRATNKWGSATTKATLVCKDQYTLFLERHGLMELAIQQIRGKHNIIVDSQLPSGMTSDRLKDLERGPVSQVIPDEEELGPPKFIEQIQSVEVAEGDNLRFECRVEPKIDPNLQVEWFHNGKPLKTGHRFRTVYDVGFVSLNILYTYASDSGEYVCRAFNKKGEDFTKATIQCKAFPSIVLQSQIPKGMKRSEAYIQMEAAIKKYTSEVHLKEDDLYDPDKKQPPRFVTQIQDQLELKEMENSKFECQLAPVGDPNMKVEWFFNGKPLPYKTRFNPIYDFGYVAMIFNWVYPEDSGEYLCRATNLYGMDETRAFIKSTGKPGIIYESQLPKGMHSVERIREMEAAWQKVPEDIEDPAREKKKPEFVLKPDPFTVQEGEWARFVCRVTGFPKPRVMFLINGKTVMNGTRYKITYDGMWHLDIPKTRQYDNGKVTIIAKNSSGEAVCVTDLVVKARYDDYRAVLKQSPKPWYDYDLKSYQQDRMESETERAFEENIGKGASVLHHIDKNTGEFVSQKLVKDAETEWQKEVKRRKNEEYYTKLKEVEDTQLMKESKLREKSHQFADPEKQPSLARGMAKSYEEKVDDSRSSKSLTTVTRKAPEPHESSIHGKEIHMNVSRQTQKEQQGDLEITRKITAKETTEVEHKAKTQERVVTGPVKPSKPPSFTKKIAPCRAFEGEPAKFEVEFVGDPAPEIKWFREEFPIKNSQEFQITTFHNKSILVIREVYLEDSAFFSVVAENRGGSAKCSANLVVEEKRTKRGTLIPPNFVMTVQDITVKTGQVARLDAKPQGTRPMDIYWLKNGRKIESDSRRKMVEEDDMCTLMIIETVPEDTATYECVAINKAGEARCEAQITVKDAQSAKPAQQKTPGGKKDTKTPKDINVIVPVKSQKVNEGQSVTFSCRLDAVPAPEVKWFKGDKQIKASKYFRMTAEGDAFSLIISEAFPEDEGMYKIVAKNPAGSVTLEAQLLVIAPQQTAIAPTLSPMKSVSVMETEPVHFVTKFTGSPTPTMQWFREGALILESDDFEMTIEGNKASLLIKDTYEEDSGVFTCRATNSAGQAETSASLEVKKKKTHPRKPGSYFGGEFESSEGGKGEKGSPEKSQSPTEEKSSTKNLTSSHVDSKSPSDKEQPKTKDDADSTDNKRLKNTKIPVSAKTEESSQPEIGNVTVWGRLRKPKVPTKTDSTTKEQSAPTKTGAPWATSSHKPPWLATSSDKQKLEKGEQPSWRRNVRRKGSETEIKEPPAINVEKKALGQDENPSHDSSPKATSGIEPRKIESRWNKSQKISDPRALSEIISTADTSQIKLKPTPKREKTPDTPKEAVRLKPTPKREKTPDALKEEIQLKPTPKREKTPDAPKEEVRLKPTPKREKTPDAPKEEVRLKPTPKREKTPDVPKEEVRLKPFSKREKAPEIAETEIKMKLFARDDQFLDKPSATTDDTVKSLTQQNVIDVTTEESRQSLNVQIEELSEIRMQAPKRTRRRRPEPSDRLIEAKDIKSLDETGELRRPKFINKLHKGTFVEPGGDLLLEVSCKGNPLPELSWFKNEEKLQRTSDIHISCFNNESRLRILHLTPEDSGVYACQAVNLLGNAITQSLVSVEVKPKGGDPPSFEIPLRAERAEPGQSVKIRALLAGSRPINIVWYHGSKELLSTEDLITDYDEEEGEVSLTIKEVLPEDEGVYRCKARNEFGLDETQMYLTVGQKDSIKTSEPICAPEIVRPLKPNSVITGNKVEFRVEFESYPKPTVTWFHKGQQVETSPRYQIGTTDHESVLVLPETFEEDTGEFMVKLMNAAGEATSLCELHVGEEIPGVSAPKLLKCPYPQRVSEGDSVIFEGIVQSDSETCLEWLINNQPIQESQKAVIKEEPNKSILMLPEVILEDAGQYTIRAKNQSGSVASSSSLIVMKKGLGVEEAIPRFLPGLQNYRVMDGEEVTLACRVHGDPTPKVTWLYNGLPLGDMRDVQMTMTNEGVCELFISEVFPEDAGEYTCKAVNEIGEATTTSFLAVEPFEYFPDSEVASLTPYTGDSGSQLEDATGASASEDDILEKDESEDDQKNSPSFLGSLPSNMEAEEKKPTKFEVKIDGNPPPKVLWYKNDVLILPKKGITVVNNEDGNSILTLAETYVEDAGVYKCEASNSHGICSSSCQLVVHPETDDHFEDCRDYRKPEWVVRLEEAKESEKGKACVDVHGVVSVRGLHACEELQWTVPKICVETTHDNLDESITDDVDLDSIEIVTSRRGSSLCGSSVGDDSVFLYDSDSHIVSSSGSLVLENQCEPFFLHTSSNSNSGRLQTVMSNYLKAHRKSINAAIEALHVETSDSLKGTDSLESASEPRRPSGGLQNNCSALELTITELTDDEALLREEPEGNSDAAYWDTDNNAVISTISPIAWNQDGIVIEEEDEEDNEMMEYNLGESSDSHGSSSYANLYLPALSPIEEQNNENSTATQSMKSSPNTSGSILNSPRDSMLLCPLKETDSLEEFLMLESQCSVEAGSDSDKTLVAWSTSGSIGDLECSFDSTNTDVDYKQNDESLSNRSE